MRHFVHSDTPEAVRLALEDFSRAASPPALKLNPHFEPPVHRTVIVQRAWRIRRDGAS
jgi:hypothetical protein